MTYINPDALRERNQRALEKKIFNELIKNIETKQKRLLLALKCMKDAGYSASEALQACRENDLL